MTNSCRRIEPFFLSHVRFWGVWVKLFHAIKEQFQPPSGYGMPDPSMAPTGPQFDACQLGQLWDSWFTGIVVPSIQCMVSGWGWLGCFWVSQILYNCILIIHIYNPYTAAGVVSQFLHKLASSFGSIQNHFLGSGCAWFCAACDFPKVVGSAWQHVW